MNAIMNDSHTVQLYILGILSGTGKFPRHSRLGLKAHRRTPTHHLWGTRTALSGLTFSTISFFSVTSCRVRWKAPSMSRRTSLSMSWAVDSLNGFSDTSADCPVWSKDTWPTAWFIPNWTTLKYTEKKRSNSLITNYLVRQSANCDDYLRVSRLRDFPEVVLRPCGDLPEENLFSHSPPEHHTHSVKQLLLSEEVLFLWQILCITQPFTPGNNGYLRENVMTDLTIRTIVWWNHNVMIWDSLETKGCVQVLESNGGRKCFAYLEQRVCMF